MSPHVAASAFKARLTLIRCTSKKTALWKDFSHTARSEASSTLKVWLWPWPTRTLKHRQSMSCCSGECSSPRYSLAWSQQSSAIHSWKTMFSIKPVMFSLNQNPTELMSTLKTAFALNAPCEPWKKPHGGDTWFQLVPSQWHWSENKHEGAWDEEAAYPNSFFALVRSKRRVQMKVRQAA